MIELIVLVIYALFFLPLFIKIISLKGRKLTSYKEVRFQIIIAAFGIVFVSLLVSLADFGVTLLWYQSIGFIKAILTRISSRVVTFLAALLVSFAMYFSAFYVPERREELEIGEKIIRYSRFFVPLVLSLFTAAAFSNNFMTVLMFINRTATTAVDPVFSKPISFYMFSYPFYSLLLGYLIGITVVAFLIEELVYNLYIRNNFSSYSPSAFHATNLLAVIGGILFLLFSAKTYLSIYSLMISSDGAVFGVGFTDLYARVPLFKLLSLIFLLCSLFLFFYAASPRFTNRNNVIKILLAGVVVGVVLYVVVPSLVQYLVVKPNELAKEKQFLTYNIEGTQAAFGLDKFNLTQVNNTQTLQPETILNDKQLTDNLRFWDWRALKDTYQQIQSIRLYYTFNDIDVDRYKVNGELREVMVSARELDQSLLSENSKTWVNLHIKYTHGYGICMNTVNEFSQEGLPNLLIKDIPPVSTVPELNVKEPEIYFGELTDNYVFVDASTPEFDYPKGEDNAYSYYKGGSGIPMTPINRLIFALDYNDQNIILSRYLNSNSKILIKRNVLERVESLAPFLDFSTDPYIVLGDDGKLYWMGDAFTYSSLYPYSESFTYNGKTFNYFRNSVKYAVDAYTGDVSFYVVDSNDILASTYQKAFPTLFKNFNEMPEFFKMHMRYPDELMEVQGCVYNVYHMTDPEVFYNKEDKWAVATEKYYSGTQQVLPYYVILENPEGNGYEFDSVYPFTPYGKNNLVALLIGRSDLPYYGQTHVMQFPKEQLFYGPLQIEARIDQDSEISKVLTLWNQQGSEVIRGNTLVMPVHNALLYLEPIYLQASSGKFPQIKKIVLATSGKLVWGDTFEDAVNLLFGGSYTPTPTPPSGQTSDKELIISAYQHLELYKQYVGSGDFDLAGKELKDLEQILKLLNEQNNP
ncbi:MAG: UPF0182 family protein [Caldisericaceae bacterium]